MSQPRQEQGPPKPYVRACAILNNSPMFILQSPFVNVATLTLVDGQRIRLHLG